VKQCFDARFLSYNTHKELTELPRIDIRYYPSAVICEGDLFRFGITNIESFLFIKNPYTEPANFRIWQTTGLAILPWIAAKVFLLIWCHPTWDISTSCITSQITGHPVSCARTRKIIVSPCTPPFREKECITPFTIHSFTSIRAVASGPGRSGWRTPPTSTTRFRGKPICQILRELKSGKRHTF